MAHQKTTTSTVSRLICLKFSKSLYVFLFLLYGCTLQIESEITLFQVANSEATKSIEDSRLKIMKLSSLLDAKEQVLSVCFLQWFGGFFVVLRSLKISSPIAYVFCRFRSQCINYMSRGSPRDSWTCLEDFVSSPILLRPVICANFPGVGGGNSVVLRSLWLQIFVTFVSKESNSLPFGDPRRAKLGPFS